jgi:hypothetical protein
MLPIIEAGALDLSFVEGEAKRLNEVQRGAGGEARSAGVSGVPVNLGVYEYDVYSQWSAIYRWWSPPNAEDAERDIEPAPAHPPM